MPFGSDRWGGPRVVPYDPNAVDADNDGLVQEGTIFERPGGTRLVSRVGRVVTDAVLQMHPGSYLVDEEGSRVDYTPKRRPAEPSGMGTVLIGDSNLHVDNPIAVQGIQTVEREKVSRHLGTISHPKLAKEPDTLDALPDDVPKIRLFRGRNPRQEDYRDAPDGERSGGWFTDSQFVAQFYAETEIDEEIVRGDVVYVDVPAEAAEALRTPSLANGREWFLPEELIGDSVEVDEWLDVDDRRPLEKGGYEVPQVEVLHDINEAIDDAEELKPSDELIARAFKIWSEDSDEIRATIASIEKGEVPDDPEIVPEANAIMRALQSAPDSEVELLRGTSLKKENLPSVGDETDMGYASMTGSRRSAEYFATDGGHEKPFSGEVRAVYTVGEGDIGAVPNLDNWESDKEHLAGPQRMRVESVEYDEAKDIYNIRLVPIEDVVITPETLTKPSKADQGRAMQEVRLEALQEADLPMMRGMFLALDDDVRDEVARLFRLPETEEQIDQHLGIGPLLLDVLDEGGLGTHWSANPGMARTAAGVDQTGRGNLEVILVANAPDRSALSDDPDLTGVLNTGEQELTVNDDAVLDLRSILVREGQSWREVLNPDTNPFPQVSEDYGDYSVITQADLLARLENAVSPGGTSQLETIDELTHVGLEDLIRSGDYKQVSKHGKVYAELKEARAKRSDIGVYLGTNGLDINRSLRGDDGIELTEAQQKAVDGLKAALAENVIESEFDTFRGMTTNSLVGDLSGDELEAAMSDLVGETISDAGFMSTSINANNALKFSRKTKLGEESDDTPPVVMRIKVPGGSEAIYVGPGMSILQEDEVILPTDTDLKVNGVTLVKSVGADGKPAYILDAEVVSDVADRMEATIEVRATTGEKVTSFVDRMEDKYPDSKIDFSVSSSKDSEGNPIATLSRIVVPEGSRGTGQGTAFMEDLNEWADTRGTTVALTPSGDFGGTVSRLKEFYKRFGYVDNKGKNKDYAISETMYRLPE